MMHFMEAYRPSSTGHLIQRIVPGARQHIHGRERPMARADVVQPGRTLWILHPLGETVPAAEAPDDLQVLLIDGSWRQARDMLLLVEPWGRRVNLPMTGESRYWLRAQQEAGRFSTIEALMFLLQALGRTTAAEAMRAQFELHVYAGLCARGKKAAAAEFLAGSPVREAFPELLARLAERRPRE